MVTPVEEKLRRLARSRSAFEFTRSLPASLTFRPGDLLQRVSGGGADDFEALSHHSLQLSQGMHVGGTWNERTNERREVFNIAESFF